MKNILILSVLLSVLPVQAMAQSQTEPVTTVAPPAPATAADQVVAEEEDDKGVVGFVQKSSSNVPVAPAVAAAPLLTTPVLIGIGVAVAVAIGVASSGSSSSSHSAVHH